MSPRRKLGITRTSGANAQAVLRRVERDVQLLALSGRKTTEELCVKRGSCESHVSVA